MTERFLRIMIQLAVQHCLRSEAAAAANLPPGVPGPSALSFIAVDAAVRLFVCLITQHGGGPSLFVKVGTWPGTPSPAGLLTACSTVSYGTLFSVVPGSRWPPGGPFLPGACGLLPSWVRLASSPPPQVLGILASVLQRDADERGPAGAFSGRPYYRMVVGFLAELSPGDAHGEAGLAYLQVGGPPSAGSG
jgi:hypothetical protein